MLTTRPSVYKYILNALCNETHILYNLCLQCCYVVSLDFVIGLREVTGIPYCSLLNVSLLLPTRENIFDLGSSSPL